MLFGIFLDFIWYLWFIPSLALFTIHIIGSKLNLFSPTYKLVNRFIYGLMNSNFVMFLLRFLHYECPFCSTTANLAANNRFSRRLVLMQKGGRCICWQNEYIFPKTAIYTIFGAICSKMQCVLVQNGVQYAAKCSAFWC